MAPARGIAALVAVLCVTLVGAGCDRQDAPRPVPSPVSSLRPGAALAAWAEEVRGGAQSVVFLQRIPKGEPAAVVRSPGSPQGPALSWPWLAWSELQAGGWRVCVLDLRSGELRRVGDGKRDATGPVVGRDWVAWVEEAAPLESDILIEGLDGGEVRTLTTLRAAAPQVVLGASQRSLAWAEVSPGAGTGVFLHDVGSGETTRVWQSGDSPALSDTHLAFRRRDAAGRWQVVLPSLATGAEIVCAVPGGLVTRPAVWADHARYVAGRDGTPVAGEDLVLWGLRAGRREPTALTRVGTVGGAVLPGLTTAGRWAAWIANGRVHLVDVRSGRRQVLATAGGDATGVSLSLR